METTIGQLLIDEALPQDMRGSQPVLNKKGLSKLLAEVAEKHPEKYREVAQKLSTLGHTAALSTGGYSFGLRHLRQPVAARKMRQQMQDSLDKLYADPQMDAKTRKAKVIELVQAASDKFTDDVFNEAKEAGNPLAYQVISGARGKPMNLRSLIGADMLYTDHRNKTLPIPVLRSYAMGLRPHEYFAGAFGARKGIIDLKTATADAGFLAKLLVQSAHRLLVSQRDGEDPYDESNPRGYPVPTDDPDSVGALLAHPVGRFARNTMITPKILKELQSEGHDSLLLRSPLVGGPKDGGVYGYDVGRRERGQISPTGDFVGIAGVQSLCLAAGTLVQMADGTQKPIEQISPGEEVLGCSQAGEIRPVKVLARFDNGIQPCVRTVFRRGTGRSTGLNLLEMISTRQHKLLSEVVIRSGKTVRQSSYFDPVALRTVDYAVRSHDRFCATLATCFDDSQLRAEPFAFMLGLLVGDGCYTGCSTVLTFSCYDPLLAADVAQYVATLGFELNSNADNEYRIVDSTNKTPKYREDGSYYRNRLMELIRNEGLFGASAATKTVPATIHQWDNASVAAYIAGHLVTAGYVISDGGVGFSSNSYQLLYEIRQLLGLRWGIWGSNIAFSQKKRTDGSNYDPNYRFVITRRTDVIELESILPIAGVKKGRLSTLLNWWNNVDRDPRAVSRVKARCSRISQEAVGDKHVYDIYVSHPDHLFLLANGLVVSNSEPITQSQISSKHSGGVAGASAGAISGFKSIAQLIQVPKTFQGGAAHSQRDGVVQAVRKASQGGHYVRIDGEDHYVGNEYELKVKQGDEVEAGDVISAGIPNPAEIVKHKGVGEGRRYFVDVFRQTLKDAGVNGHRRNIELLSRGLINHVRLTDEYDDHVPDDVLPYQFIEANWKPRPGHHVTSPRQAVGKYLERPVLHYSIGTKVRPSVARQLEKYKVGQVYTHHDPAPFEPEMVRGMANAAHDPDFMTKMLGSYQKGSILEAAQRGGTSDASGTSYPAALARGTTFGLTGKTKGWKAEPPGLDSGQTF